MQVFLWGAATGCALFVLARSVMTKTLLSPSAQKVQDALRTFGLSLQVIELPASTRTAQEAANAVGCQVGQIVKSLIFQGKQSGKPYLILVSGANRADEARLSALIGEPIGKADADFARNQTGFAIGGIPPVGHREPIETFIDQELLEHDELWAAAGTPNAVFKLLPGDLARITQGNIANIC
jgi:prolyl-tRNA editing enzyme YbaK/EbsC (Cys-tRNA(Pro) deacylase)